jgi:hypothetical protein
METGVPAKPAANVARLAPGFRSCVPVAGLSWPRWLGTLAWIALARWRTGRHRTALWKSMVLPAAGTTLVLVAADDAVAAGAGLWPQLRAADARSARAGG